jgi:hypothetical protein
VATIVLSGRTSVSCSGHNSTWLHSVVTVLAGSAWRLCNTQSQGTKSGQREGRTYQPRWGGEVESPSSPDPPHLSYATAIDATRT